MNFKVYIAGQGKEQFESLLLAFLFYTTTQFHILMGSTYSKIHSHRSKEKNETRQHRPPLFDHQASSTL